MTWRVEVATNKEATTWADITAYVDRTSLAVGGTAHEIEIDTGSGFDAADDDGVTLSIPTRRVVRVIEDATTPDTVLFRGRSIGRALARGTLPIADANQKDVNLVDFNADLGGIPIARSFRPEESDHARIRVYLETFLQGTHRASTNLLDTYLQTTSPITLEKYVYEDATPATVFQHIIGETGKECFVTVDGELFYGPGTSTVYAASLAITDVDPDSITTFAPIAPRGDEDGSEYASGIKVIYKGRQTTTVLDATSEDAHDYWRITHTDESIPSLAAALRRGNKLLAEHKQDEIRYECSIQLRDDQVDLIKYGQTVSFRSAAAGVLSPVTVRVKRLLWEEAAPRIWLARLELGFPKKVAPRLPPANRVPSVPSAATLVEGSVVNGTHQGHGLYLKPGVEYAAGLFTNGGFQMSTSAPTRVGFPYTLTLVGGPGYACPSGDQFYEPVERHVVVRFDTSAVSRPANAVAVRIKTRVIKDAWIDTGTDPGRSGAIGSYVMTAGAYYSPTASVGDLTMARFYQGTTIREIDLSQDIVCGGYLIDLPIDVVNFGGQTDLGFRPMWVSDTSIACGDAPAGARFAEVGCGVGTPTTMTFLTIDSDQFGADTGWVPAIVATSSDDSSVPVGNETDRTKALWWKVPAQLYVSGSLVVTLGGRTLTPVLEWAEDPQLLVFQLDKPTGGTAPVVRYVTG
jgi:hypothetical protein